MPCMQSLVICSADIAFAKLTILHIFCNCVDLSNDVFTSHRTIAVITSGSWVVDAGDSLPSISRGAIPKACPLLLHCCRLVRLTGRSWLLKLSPWCILFSPDSHQKLLRPQCYFVSLCVKVIWEQIQIVRRACVRTESAARSPSRTWALLSV